MMAGPNHPLLTDGLRVVAARDREAPGVVTIAAS
jgi:hypothetical protein